MVGGRGLVNIFLSLVSRSILMSTCPLAKMTQFEYTNSTSHVYGGFLKWWYPTTIGFNTHMGSCPNPVMVDKYSIHSYEGTFISLHYPRRKTKNPLFQCFGRTIYVQIIVFHANFSFLLEIPFSTDPLNISMFLEAKSMGDLPSVIKQSGQVQFSSSVLGFPQDDLKKLENSQNVDLQRSCFLPRF